MEADTLSSEKVVQALKGFVPVRLNHVLEAGTARKYGVQQVPATLILASQGELLALIEGDFTPDRYVERLQEVIEDDRRLRAGQVTLQTSPDDLRANFDVGSVLRLRGDYAKAIPLLLKALRLDERNVNDLAAEANLHLAYANLRKGDLAASRRHCAQIGALDPDDKHGYRDDALFIACELALRGKDWKGAETMMTGFLKDLPQSEYAPHVYVYLGMTYLKMDDKARALETFKKGVELHPVSYWSLYARNNLIPPLEK